MGDLRIEVGAGGAVRTITLDRAEKRNALTREMFDVLIDAFTVEPPAQERVTVIAAEGPVFCAGVDLGQRAGNETSEGRSPLELLCAAVAAYPLPVVAVVQGHAIGGGAMLALHCDLIVAVEEARFGNAAVQAGLTPAWGVSRHILEIAGEALGRELLLLGDPIEATQLARAGVITAAVPEAALRGATRRIVARLAANAPLSLRAVKATLAARPFAERDHAEVTALVERVQRSEDAVEGGLARKERRAPLFTGR
jgi:enoyl-CoA hydratase/carnithine racemase